MPDPATMVRETVLDQGADTARYRERLHRERSRIDAELSRLDQYDEMAARPKRKRNPLGKGGGGASRARKQKSGLRAAAAAAGGAFGSEYIPGPAEVGAAVGAGSGALLYRGLDALVGIIRGGKRR